MSIKDQLDPFVAKWDLLHHPFYRAWSAGTLPIESLRTYAAEYGAFVGLLPQAWGTLHDADTAEEEGEHVELWSRFAAALDTRVTGQAKIPAVQALTTVAARLFADPASAAGALYAFEVQQPATAQSKLDGLKTHYRLPQGVEPYFEIHSHNEHEAHKLLARIEALPSDDQARSLEACAMMSEALWNALTGIYGEDCRPD